MLILRRRHRPITTQNTKQHYETIICSGSRSQRWRLGYQSNTDRGAEFNGQEPAWWQSSSNRLRLVGSIGSISSARIPRVGFNDVSTGLNNYEKPSLETHRTHRHQ